MAIRLKNETNACRRLDMYLSAVQRTEMQARHYLIKQGYTSEEVNAAIDKALQQGVINDRFFASEYVRIHSTKYGKIKLRHNLLKKGVSPELIDEVLAANEDGEEEMASATRLAEKLIEGKPVDYKLCAKVARRLQSAGFSTAIVVSVLNKYFNDDHSGDQ